MYDDQYQPTMWQMEVDLDTMQTYERDMELRFDRHVGVF